MPKVHYGHKRDNRMKVWPHANDAYWLKVNVGFVYFVQRNIWMIIISITDIHPLFSCQRLCTIPVCAMNIFAYCIAYFHCAEAILKSVSSIPFSLCHYFLWQCWGWWPDGLQSPGLLLPDTHYRNKGQTLSCYGRACPSPPKWEGQRAAEGCEY